MIGTKQTFIASFLMIFLGVCTPTYAAGQGVKTKEFLMMDEGAKDYFIKLTINTATVIATQVKREMAICISDWYTGDPQTNQLRNDEILKIMATVPDSFPSAVLIAILQKKCGKFGH